jgi:hypothetical protein
LGEIGKQINTLILKKDDKFIALPLELYYRGTCLKIIEKLQVYFFCSLAISLFNDQEARKACENISFCLYLDAKIEELRTGFFFSVVILVWVFLKEAWNLVMFQMRCGLNMTIK